YSLWSGRAGLVGPTDLDGPLTRLVPRPPRDLKTRMAMRTLARLATTRRERDAGRRAFSRTASVTQRHAVGITSRSTFDSAPPGEVSWRPMDGWLRSSPRQHPAAHEQYPLRLYACGRILSVASVRVGLRHRWGVGPMGGELRLHLSEEGADAERL